MTSHTASKATRRHATTATADLSRSIHPLPEGLNVDFIRASSYHGTSTSTSGSVEVSSLQKLDILGRHVLLVSSPRTLRKPGTTAQNRALTEPC